MANMLHLVLMKMSGTPNLVLIHACLWTTWISFSQLTHCCQAPVGLYLCLVLWEITIGGRILALRRGRGQWCHVIYMMWYLLTNRIKHAPSRGHHFPIYNSETVHSLCAGKGKDRSRWGWKRPKAGGLITIFLGRHWWILWNVPPLMEAVTRWSHWGWRTRRRHGWKGTARITGSAMCGPPPPIVKSQRTY